MEKIIVIGAGIAGLTTAKTLQDHGKSVSILEARNRIGGRLWTVDKIDLGGQWIHGSGSNPLINFANQYNIPTIFVGGDSTYMGGWEQLQMRLPGTKIMSENQKWLCIKIWDEINEQLDENRFKNKLNNIPDQSIANLLKNIINKLNKNHKLNSQQKKYILWHLNALCRDDFAATPNNLSSYYWDDGYESYGYGDSIFSKGYSAIYNKLAKNLDIKLNTVVKEIDSSNPEKIIIKTNKKKFIANKLIITIPLGVLKSKQVKFLPKLDQAKQHAIKKLGFGCLAKIVVFFDKVFWPKDQYVFGYFAKNLSNTPTHIVNLFKFNNIKALAIPIGGKAGMKIEKNTKKQNLIWTMNILRDMFGEDIPKPKKIICTNWSQDKFSLGAYSYMALGAKPSDIENLAKPIENRIYFAGEATNRQSWGNTHGAFVSALKACALILNNPSIVPINYHTENKRWRNIFMRISRFLSSMKFL